MNLFGWCTRSHHPHPILLLLIIIYVRYFVFLLLLLFMLLFDWYIIDTRSVLNLKITD